MTITQKILAISRRRRRHLLYRIARRHMAARNGRPVTSFTPALTALAAGAGPAFYLATAHHGYHAPQHRSTR